MYRQRSIGVAKSSMIVFIVSRVTRERLVRSLRNPHLQLIDVTINSDYVPRGNVCEQHTTIRISIRTNAACTVAYIMNTIVACVVAGGFRGLAYLMHGTGELMGLLRLICDQISPATHAVAINQVE